MASLADVPDLVGFFSYSRDDDDDSDGALSKLRERVQAGLRGHLGRTKRDFRLWQDKTAIVHGELWEDRIRTAIAESVFFIPIITPTAVRSHHCKFEFESFLAREKELGRSDLVFPILYIPVPALEDGRWRHDPVLEIVHSRQYLDWGPLRHLSSDSPEFKRTVEHFSANISRALQRPWLSPQGHQEAEARRRAEEKRPQEEVRQRAKAERRREEKLQEEVRQRAKAERRREEKLQEEVRQRAEAERRREEKIQEEARPESGGTANATRVKKSGILWSAIALATAANLLIWLWQAQLIDALSSLWSVSGIGFKSSVLKAETIISTSQWIIPALMLMVVALVRFNSPGNRSGTTFALFWLGLITYFALIVLLWFVVTMALRQGILGFDRLYLVAQSEVAQYAPLVAALVLVAATQLSWVRHMDIAGRALCLQLAAIPREADRLALELAQTAAFQPSQRLQGQVRKIITETIGSQALCFEPDGSLAARFTRAVGLYWLFIGPQMTGIQLNFATTTNTRSFYAGIMQLNERTLARAAADYEELMQAASAYFTTPRPAKEVQNALNRMIVEVSLFTCSLIARYILYCNITSKGRRRQLASMGFDASHHETGTSDTITPASSPGRVT
jgi:hypothetical protein